MKILVAKNYKDMSRIASEILIDEINRNPNQVMGFATGKTPLGTYKNLVRAYKKKRVDFSKIKTFNLDEYYPIPKKDRKSYFYYMHKNLFDKVNIKKQNINLLDGETDNPKKECDNYEKKVLKNQIDIQILGVGVNGHIGFNEPGTKITSKTRLVDLSESTKKINRTNKQALTLGMGTILKAKKIILLANGRNKETAIKCLVRSNPEMCCPVSYLKNHKDLIVIGDKKALKDIDSI